MDQIADCIYGFLQSMTHYCHKAVVKKSCLIDRFSLLPVVIFMKTTFESNSFQMFSTKLKHVSTEK